MYVWRYLIDIWGALRFGHRFSLGHWMEILWEWYGWWIGIGFFTTPLVCNYWTLFFRRTIIEPHWIWYLLYIGHVLLSYSSKYLSKDGFVCLNLGVIKCFCLTHVFKMTVRYLECFIWPPSFCLHLLCIVLHRQFCIW